MDRFIINSEAQANGAYEIHNMSKGCEHLPMAQNQNQLGFFATWDLALKRARTNWPREKISLCQICCK
ncbi:hypothetical protein BEN71_15270 [Acinetobacter wuhouensis]|uniref:Uncharacterized protein n=1 Tax=Acinetobacter wuhouensis TaxID=1879050 RepID=A0A385C6N4_9GAMM|nr:hypothetical protein [Acinetobacter wuhouensis]AXQ23348.1 hypothetical protein BEN71_15270 [Acinetobacter wuhouensis]AYO55445.1 hypothetical protein CDG68_18085 [Acinetobacter wuhouensis]RZG46570.1 hypothetical protein EXU28_08275 [Acinetobacter wuhouensis]RZG72325.1 hypothetical protein EXU29_10405 [Acinetobacter wuhouensis]